jgi:hypothetical protein
VRILVTGSRSWRDAETVRRALAEVWDPKNILISGGCPTGADALAEACWRHWGGTVDRYMADWLRYGKRAGLVRNVEMVKAKPDVLLAFIVSNSPGASHTLDMANRYGIPDVRVHRR